MTTIITSAQTVNAMAFMGSAVAKRDIARDVSATMRPHAAANGLKMKAPVKGPNGWIVGFSHGKTLSLKK